MFRNFSFQNSLIVTRCLKSCFYRTSDNEHCFYILEVSTIKIIALIITKLCIYLRTIAGEWHYLPAALFGLVWGFFGLDIYYWNFNNVFISDL